MKTQLMTASDQELAAIVNIAKMSQVTLSPKEDKEHWRNLATCSLEILRERGVITQSYYEHHCQQFLGPISSVRLLQMRNADNADQVDAELDRRNRQAARSVTKRRKPKTFLMADHHFEENRWDLDDPNAQ